MELYVCWGTFPTPGYPGGHPCRNAYTALKDAGHDPEVKRAYGWRMLPDVPFNVTPGRLKVKRLTGSTDVPVLYTDEGDVVKGTRRIVEWAEKNAR